MSDKTARTLPDIRFTVHEHPLTLATVAAWRDLVARVSCDGPCPIKFWVTDLTVEPGGKIVPAQLFAAMATTPVPGSMTIESGDYKLQTSVKLVGLGPPSLSTIYRLARLLYSHELMEWFKVDGESHENPHPGWAYTLDHPEGLCVREVNKR